MNRKSTVFNKYITKYSGGDPNVKIYHYRSISAQLHKGKPPPGHPMAAFDDACWYCFSHRITTMGYRCCFDDAQGTGSAIG